MTSGSVPRIDLVVTDLDGTLWHTPDTVHPDTLRALAEVQRRGVPLLAATGRRVGSTRRPLEAWGLTPPAVVLNGGLGLDLGSGRRFHRAGFSSEDAIAVLAVFVEWGVEPVVHIDDEVFPVRIGTDPATHPGHIASFGSEVLSCSLEAVVAEEHVFGFGVLGLDPGVATRLADALGEVATPHVDGGREYAGHSVTVASPAQSKWLGVEAFCAAEGIDAGAVLAIGDGPNDTELLDGAAVALVPEDGHADALARADRVVGRASEGGWSAVLDHI